MLKHTDAYIAWRTSSQDMLDFAVMICTAAPQLKHALAERDADPNAFVAANSGFRPSEVPYSTERRALSHYKKVLGANLLLAVFSYFESYIFAAIDEVIDFHGGEEMMEENIRKQAYQRPPTKAQKSKLSGLRAKYKPSRADKYRKVTSSLDVNEIVWPSQRLMLYGFKQMLTQKKRWKSFEIPDLLEYLLTFAMTQAERDKFHTIRADRNQIAHGKGMSYDLKKATLASNYFRELALRIDEHIVEYFFIMERYAH